MVEQSFWEMLRVKRDSLTKSGIIVADYLVQHAEDAQYLSISSLAKACGVAEATIFRFCRSLGFEGYNEMKIALAKATATAVPVYQKLEPGVDTQTLCTHAQHGRRRAERHPRGACPRRRGQGRHFRHRLGGPHEGAHGQARLQARRGPHRREKHQRARHKAHVRQL